LQQKSQHVFEINHAQEVREGAPLLERGGDRRVSGNCPRKPKISKEELKQIT
jgi:hypothetical protein